MSYFPRFPTRAVLLAMIGAMLLLAVLVASSCANEKPYAPSVVDPHTPQLDLEAFDATLNRVERLEMAMTYSIQTRFEPLVMQLELMFSLSDEETSQETLYQTAHSVLKWSDHHGVPTQLVMGVMLIENPWLIPDTTSSAGAIGLMQVMPFHAGSFGCEEDLTDIDANICTGVAVLRRDLDWALDKALLKYNGCVVAPGCESYSSKVRRGMELLSGA